MHFSKPPIPVEVLWCTDSKRNTNRGWMFPPRVAELLEELTAGKTVLHLFGGRARWGVRLDIDPIVRPDVIGDAWLPPFAESSFDVVILDPPYVALNGQLRTILAHAASYIARERVIWFHTLWLSSGCGLITERAWLVRVGRTCAVRCLIVFRRNGARIRLQEKFTRGPAIRYNRWMVQPAGLAFPKAERIS